MCASQSGKLAIYRVMDACSHILIDHFQDVQHFQIYCRHRHDNKAFSGKMMCTIDTAQECLEIITVCTPNIFESPHGSQKWCIKQLAEHLLYLNYVMVLFILSVSYLSRFLLCEHLTNSTLITHYCITK